MSILFCAGCGSTGGGSRAGDPVSMREGIITYFEPRAPRDTRVRGVRQIASGPSTVVVATRTESGETVDRPAEYTATAGRLGDRSLADVLRQAARKHRKVVSPDQFQTLWDALLDVGVTELPRSLEEEPPTDRAWIRVQAEGRQTVFLQPVQGYREIRDERDRRLNSIFSRAKALVIQVANS